MASSSYRQIVRSTAMVGGAQIVNLAVGLARTKAMALLLGPLGIGLLGMLQSTVDLAGSVAGLGLEAAGVRQVAEATGSNDGQRLSRATVVLRRATLSCGLVGMALVALLSYPLALATFGSSDRAWALVVVSATLLLRGFGAGQTALLQGTRRVRELATGNVAGAALGAAVGVALVYALGESGLALFLVAVAAFKSLASWWFARQVPLEPVELPWRDTFREARPLLRMGLSFLVSGLLAAGTAYLTRVLVNQRLGMSAVGLYAAAWTVSFLYADVILGAMGTDFYPRLTAVAKDNTLVNLRVNEQTEVGLLMALPGLLATLALAPWMLRALYSAQFVPAAEVARWLLLGAGLRVVSWPLGYIQLAKGWGGLFVATELLANLLQVGLLLVGVRVMGLTGCGIAFFGLYAVYTPLIRLACGRLTGFSWSPRVRRLLALGAAATLAVLAAERGLPQPLGLAGGLLIAAATGGACLWELRRMLGPDPTVWMKGRLGPGGA